MRGYLYQYTKFELITMIEQYDDYIQSVYGGITPIKQFIETVWEIEEEPKAE